MLYLFWSNVCWVRCLKAPAGVPERNVHVGGVPGRPGVNAAAAGGPLSEDAFSYTIKPFNSNPAELLISEEFPSPPAG